MKLNFNSNVIKWYKNGVKLEIGVIEFTPEMAQFVLDMRNNHNRDINARLSDKITSIMSEHKWLLINTLVFDAFWNLLDGQHRLVGVVKSGIPAAFLVVKGHDPDIFALLDSTLRKRNTVDAVTIADPNAKYKSSISSSIRLITAIKNRTLNVRVSTCTTEFTPEDVLRERENYPELERSLAVGSTLKYLLNPSTTSALHYLFAEAMGVDKANEFFDRLHSRVDLDKNNPIYVLGRRLDRDKRQKATMEKNYIVGLTIKAWNLWLSGAKVGNIGGFHNVSVVPDIIGLDYDE